MKVLMINEVCGVTSTGRICTDIAAQLEKEGHECRIAYGRMTVPEQFQKYAIRIGNNWDVRFHALKTRLFDDCGFGSKHATEKFIKWVKEYDPDVIHLHNLHGYYIHIGVLFDYLRTCGKRIIWTLHDCWAFTGHCSHYTYAKCQQWQTGCEKCTQLKEYPACFMRGNVKDNYKKKKKAFTKIPNITIVTPSEWLASMVSSSFLNVYQVKVIHNGINMNLFKPSTSHLREKYGLQGKQILLGVSNVWNERKGFKDFIDLSLKIDVGQRIVLIGLKEKQLKRLPSDIVGITRTDSVKELAEWYSTADVFLNLTYEDNYPTVNLEAQACGTPVITYATGGSVESVPAENIVPVGDINAVLEKMKDSLKLHETDSFSGEKANEEYIALY